jgi:hypothetical protein
MLGHFMQLSKDETTGLWWICGCCKKENRATFAYTSIIKSLAVKKLITINKMIPYGHLKREFDCSVSMTFKGFWVKYKEEN